MFFRRIVLIFVCGLALLAPGCFEIKEIVKFNADGSGTFSMVVGIQEQFRALVAMSRKMQQEKARKQAEAERAKKEAESGEEAPDPDLPLLEEDPGAATPKPGSDAGESFEQSRTKIEKIPGISNVRSIRDEDNFRFGLNFDFASVDALNKALHQMQKDPGPKGAEYFVFSRGSFQRLARVGFKDSIAQSMSQGKSKDGEPPSAFNPAALGIRFLYITEYTFPGKIRKVSNPRAVVMPDKKTVRMEHSLLDPDQRDSNVGNKIAFERWYHKCLPFL